MTERELTEMGFTLGVRDPRVRRGDHGSFMVVAPFDYDAELNLPAELQPWAIVGDDLDALILEAIATWKRKGVAAVCDCCLSEEVVVKYYSRQMRRPMSHSGKGNVERSWRLCEACSTTFVSNLATYSNQYPAGARELGAAVSWGTNAVLRRLEVLEAKLTRERALECALRELLAHSRLMDVHTEEEARARWPEAYRLLEGGS